MIFHKKNGKKCLKADISSQGSLGESETVVHLSVDFSARNHASHRFSAALDQLEGVVKSVKAIVHGLGAVPVHGEHPGVVVVHQFSLFYLRG